MVNNNKDFDKVYNKLIVVSIAQLKHLKDLRVIGRSVNYTNIKILNLYIRYLDNIKKSKYNYFTIPGLNNISNFLNTL